MFDNNNVCGITTASSTGGGYYSYPQTTYTQHQYPNYDCGTGKWVYPNINIEVDGYDKALKDLKKLKKKLKKEKNMKNLYQVIVVSIDEEILLEDVVVASDKEEAQYEAEVYEVLKKEGLKPKDVTIITRDLGAVKVRPETKTVKIVKE